MSNIKTHTCNFLAVIQCKMKSGRYRTAVLSRHWSANTKGLCLAPTCKDTQESLEHLLIHYPYYYHTREKLIRLWTMTTPSTYHLVDLLASVLAGPTYQLLSFILDPASHHSIRHLASVYGQEILYRVFYLTRTWCFAIHKQRCKLLKTWKF